MEEQMELQNINPVKLKLELKPLSDGRYDHAKQISVFWLSSDAVEVLICGADLVRQLHGIKKPLMTHAATLLRVLRRSKSISELGVAAGREGDVLAVDGWGGHITAEQLLRFRRSTTAPSSTWRP
ncbi:hypothetical protein C2S53_014018 [Perilla frutescens var. hirtella]|uniref:Uncharacterized protein n=1 Tax=Perilla frutescens var. hirtella TaxID=608512 RepID=A0AAD4IRL5_PERFH|nr:hypothetical protein C2S53_014018 [Perilla frutescens var. hirtella]